jgi:hypothetical protein
LAKNLDRRRATALALFRSQFGYDILDRLPEQRAIAASRAANLR